MEASVRPRSETYSECGWPAPWPSPSTVCTYSSAISRNVSVHVSPYVGRCIRPGSSTRSEHGRPAASGVVSDFVYILFGYRRENLSE